jgi:hypothetical protein
MSEIIELACGSESKRPGCVLIQAAYGCSSSIVDTVFDTDDWMLAPSERMVKVPGTLEQWKKHAEHLRFKRTIFNMVVHGKIVKKNLNYDDALTALAEERAKGNKPTLRIVAVLNRNGVRISN